MKVKELIELLKQTDPDLEIAIEHDNPDYAEGYWDDPTVYTNIELNEILVKDGSLVLDISSVKKGCLDFDIS